jgi:hypothetical protein
MSALYESRDILRDTFEEFKRDQDEYRKQLEDISKSKEAALGRRKGKYCFFLCKKRNIFFKKMQFQFRSLCDKNVIVIIWLIFVRIPV